MTAYVNTQNGGTLNLRQQPNSSGILLAQIPNKTQLEVEGLDSTWTKTTYKNKIGYVMTKFLSTSLSSSTISKADLERIYNSLKSTLATIESILK